MSAEADATNRVRIADGRQFYERENVEHVLIVCRI